MAPPGPQPSGHAGRAARAARPGTAQGRVVDGLSAAPWWVILLLLAGVVLSYKIATNALYSFILSKLLQGLATTLVVAFTAYVGAMILGLLGGLGRVSRNPVAYHLATLYVQVIRGVPILVQIIYVAFVLTPLVVDGVHAVGRQVAPVLGDENVFAQLSIRDIPFAARAIIALAIAYGGFEAETFRAGIQSVGRGQVDAAMSLGMTRFQAMRLIVLPQALRVILPPLGNDLIAMVKDSALVSVIGVTEMTQEARLYAARTFQTLPTYNMLAFMYLSLTLALSVVVKLVEERLSASERPDSDGSFSRRAGRAVRSALARAYERAWPRSGRGSRRP